MVQFTDGVTLEENVFLEEGAEFNLGQVKSNEAEGRPRRTAFWILNLRIEVEVQESAVNEQNMASGK